MIKTKLRSLFANTTLLLMLAGLSGFATAQLRVIVNAVEAAPSNMILPGSTNGMMSFRPCADECDRDYVRIRLTAGSQFFVNDKRVLKYEDFISAFNSIKSQKASYGLVSFDTDNNTLTSLKIAN